MARIHAVPLGRVSLCGIALLVLAGCAAEEQGVGATFEPSVVVRLLGDDPEYDSVGVFFGTTRDINDEESPNDFFGSRHSGLTVGHTWLSIPRSHETGVVERPVADLAFLEDPNSHIVLLTIETFPQAELAQRITQRAGGSRDVLVFVHGYNVTFAEASRRFAQMVHDIGFAGVPFLFSWPSNGDAVSYVADAEDVQLAVPYLESLLTTLVREVRPERIHLLAHSMGNRALLRSLRNLRITAPDVEFDEIILAAADIGATEFREQILPRFEGMSGRITAYSSDSDRPLQLSAGLSEDVRLGQSGVSLQLLPGMDIVDATGLDLSLLGHSYMGEVEVVMKDIGLLLNGGSRTDRNLLAMPDTLSPTHWRLPCDPPSQGDRGARAGRC